MPSFHANWATRLADQLTDSMPNGFVAEEFSHPSGSVEIDVATYRDADSADPHRSAWQPTTADHSADLLLPDQYEVKVFRTTGGRTLVAAIELIRPGNKDREAERTAFVAKCASYLHAGVSLIVVDVVTERTANLHNRLMRHLGADASTHLPEPGGLYAVAYRPVVRNGQSGLDIWKHSLRLGEPLPELPLRLVGDCFVAVDLEASYQEACRRRRLSG